jgi:hypothetical protein
MRKSQQPEAILRLTQKPFTAIRSPFTVRHIL